MRALTATFKGVFLNRSLLADEELVLAVAKALADSGSPYLQKETRQTHELTNYKRTEGSGGTR